MQYCKLDEMSKEKKAKYLNRGAIKDTKVAKTVRSIIKKVRSDGDAALYFYLKEFNNAEPKALKVGESELEQAYKSVDQRTIDALKQAKKNLEIVYKNQYIELTRNILTIEKGIKVWRVWRPIEKVGLYIPGGKAVYPSSVLMLGIPAIKSGCKEIILCTPPSKSGTIPSPTLVAADMVGIKNIYKIGGAEAIAAMTFGTESIPSVYKIFGPGNKYVTEAKRQLFGRINIDMPAGPSEVFIIADESGNPKFIAADLLADGEHGEDSKCILVTTSKFIAEKTLEQLDVQLKTLSTKERINKSLRNYGLILLVDTLDQAVDFANEYAPEHLELMVKNPEAVLLKITNAGSVFLGTWSSKSAGDYATGANHVLPTGGSAKMFSSLSIEDFGRLMEVQKVESKEALSLIKQTIETFGEIENLPAHKNATSIRFS